jgi:hypothetical protein
MVVSRLVRWWWWCVSGLGLAWLCSCVAVHVERDVLCSCTGCNAKKKVILWYGMFQMRDRCQFSVLKKRPQNRPYLTALLLPRSCLSAAAV